MARDRDPVDVDATLLGSWPLPEPSGSKRSRGDVVVVGGARYTPGAAQLAGLSALRAGAGRLTLAVAASVATEVAVAVPESGVLPLEETASGHVRGAAVRAFARELGEADAVLVGPGLDDIREAERMLAALSDLAGIRASSRRARSRAGGGDGASSRPTLVLDAYALGALAVRRRRGRPGRRTFPNAILKPNESEAEVLLGHPIHDLLDDTRELAARFGAVVSCMGVIADPEGAAYRVREAGPGLGTSGSGDVLAGAIAGLAARGCPPLQAAVWGTALHARAGAALAASVAPLGYLARDLSARLPAELGALTAR